MGLRLRVLLPFVLIGAALLLTLYGYWMPRHVADLKHAYHQATEKHLVSVAEGLIPLLLARQLDAVYENLDALMLQNADWKSLRFFNDDGIMVYPLFPPPPAPAGLDVRVMEQAVRLNEADLGRLVVEVDFDGPLKEMRVRYRQLFGITAVVLLLSIAVIWLVIERLVSRPITDLAQASRLLAEGDFAAPLPQVQRNEVGELVQSFGEMRASLRSYQAELVSQNESLVKLSHAVEQSPVSIVIADRAGRIEFVNPRFEEVMGCGPDEMLGQNLRRLKTDEGPGPSFDEIWGMVSSGKVWHGEFQSARAGGQVFWQSASLSAVQNEAGETTHVVALLQDISERRALEAQLRQAQKMEAVGTLAGGIAHDFNNLLTAILGFSEMALAEISPQSPVAERLRVIHEAGEKAAALTRQLLAFSRKQVLEVKVVEIDAIVENLSKILRRIIGEDVQLKIRSAPGAKCVRADPGQIEQVLMNLAVNARDAMPRGGWLTIGTERVDLDEEYAKDHAGVTPGPHVLLAVTDNGVGMSREVQEKIFEPFFSTKGDRGTGLGLSTVYGIVRQHGGHVNVYSEPAVGTTFKIYLPLVGEAAEEPAPADQGFDLRGTETILVVDDEPYVRRLVVDTLRPLGYTLLEASSAQEALQISTATAKDIDVLFTDVVMPGMSGIELARRIRERRPAITVIFASGYTDGTVFSSALLAERANFLQKPITPKKLIGKLKSIGVSRPSPVRGA